MKFFLSIVRMQSAQATTAHALHCDLDSELSQGRLCSALGEGDVLLREFPSNTWAALDQTPSFPASWFPPLSTSSLVVRCGEDQVE